MSQCPYKIRWTFSRDTQCTLPVHVQRLTILPEPDGTFRTQIEGDPQHSGPAGEGSVSYIHWQAGDRREFTGDWPGPCTKLAGCTLHTGHHGRCAP